MKIEKISDTQIKIILSETDLSERNITMTELTRGSDKTHELFHEIMEKASSEHDFKADGSPLMIEASPFSVDSILMIITKVQDEASDTMSRLNFLSQITQLIHAIETGSRPPAGKTTKKPPAQTRLVFSFPTIDDTITAASRVKDIFNGFSSFIKIEEKYYLIFENKDKRQVAKFRHLERVLNEYGQKHYATVLTEAHLKEHGEVLIESNAVGKLSSII